MNNLKDSKEFKNEVKLTGQVHFLSSTNKSEKYYGIAIRHENDSLGSHRKDFLNVRISPKDLQEKVKSFNEGDFIEVKGKLSSSKGSGELYLSVEDLIEYNSDAEIINEVKLTGYVHKIKAQSEGETGSGKYIRFALRQEDEYEVKEYLVVRVYDEKLRREFALKNDDEYVEVEGTLRSSKGSGVNYIRCVSLK